MLSLEPQRLSKPALLTIASKALAGERLNAEEGLALLQCEDSAAVASLADAVRKKRVGESIYYTSTLYLHPTNLCELSCPMCSYYAKPGWKTAWFMTPAQLEEHVLKSYPLGISEIHIVGGLWRECNLDYYQDLFTRIKKIDPKLHIKALTPVEYDFLAKHHGISIEEVLKRMISWGLGSLPGGGAEILVESIRKQVAPQKISSEEYLAVHKIAHNLGLPSNITMLFGHVEEYEHIITHLTTVRDLQDETKGFRAFVPLKYHEENNALGKRKKRIHPKELTKIYAVSRLMLDNIPQIKVLWNYLGVDEALKMLASGGNDLGSTAFDEKIIKMAGGVEVKMTAQTMDTLITKIGRTPKHAHSGY